MLARQRAKSEIRCQFIILVEIRCQFIILARKQAGRGRLLGRLLVSVLFSPKKELTPIIRVGEKRTDTNNPDTNSPGAH